MSLFGAIIRTAINVVALPVTLPLSLTKDLIEGMASGDLGDNTTKLIEQIKDEAETE